MKISKRRHLISLSDMSDDEMAQLVKCGLWYAQNGTAAKKPLSGLLIGIYFLKTSTRTRTSFSSAALRLGAQIISYGSSDLQENTGETMEDTGRVLSRMLDGIVMRTAGCESRLRTFASFNSMSVVNAMTANEHPTQALADLTTMVQHFGDFKGLRVLYLGEGNNTAAALALSLPRFAGTELYFCTPRGYGIPAETMEAARQYAKKHGTNVTEQHDLKNLPGEFDVIYTTRWETTGTSKSDPHWKDIFKPFKVTQSLIDRYPSAIFMHDLPAHREEEVDASVLDGNRSIAFTQAENKMHSACAVLEWCLKPGSI
ncbi:hypothetical protein [Chitinophaga sp.]|uniref:ornithine carbamoyltransferase n=1 Tax=Chitinophaga sp. TaxID=1869181 RepID=UPI002F947FD5